MDFTINFYQSTKQALELIKEGVDGGSFDEGPRAWFDLATSYNVTGKVEGPDFAISVGYRTEDGRVELLVTFSSSGISVDINGGDGSITWVAGVTKNDSGGFEGNVSYLI